MDLSRAADETPLGKVGGKGVVESQPQASMSMDIARNSLSAEESRHRDDADTQALLH